MLYLKQRGLCTSAHLFEWTTHSSGFLFVNLLCFPSGVILFLIFWSSINDHVDYQKCKIFNFKLFELKFSKIENKFFNRLNYSHIRKYNLLAFPLNYVTCVAGNLALNRFHFLSFLIYSITFANRISGPITVAYSSLRCKSSEKAQ